MRASIRIGKHHVKRQPARQLQDHRERGGIAADGDGVRLPVDRDRDAGGRFIVPGTGEYEGGVFHCAVFDCVELMIRNSLESSGFQSQFGWFGIQSKLIYSMVWI